jgi:hypothetical protein
MHGDGHSRERSTTLNPFKRLWSAIEALAEALTVLASTVRTADADLRVLETTPAEAIPEPNGTPALPRPAARKAKPS